MVAVKLSAAAAAASWMTQGTNTAARMTQIPVLSTASALLTTPWIPQIMQRFAQNKFCSTDCCCCRRAAA